VNYQTFKKAKKQIEKDAAVIANRRTSQRKLDSDKLLTMKIIDAVSRKNGEISYFNRKGEVETIKARDLKQSQAKEKKHFGRAGITIQSLMKRTNNQWLTRSKKEIKTGHVSQVKSTFEACKVIIYTGKSSESKWPHPKHRVVVDLKDYHEYLSRSPGDKYKKNAKAAISGTIGVYCDCEDFQYRRAYWVQHIGAFVSSDRHIKPETAFPKITHPRGERGPLCIHLIKACKTLMQPTSVAILARTMNRDAGSKNAGSDRVINISEKQYNEFIKEIGKEKVEKIKNEWLEKEARKDFKKFRKAGESFMKQNPKMKEAIKGVRKMLKDGIPIKKIVEYSILPKKQIEEIAKKVK
jgi:hypothetical protein